MSPTQDCGRSLEDLSDYLETGRSPDADHIDHCPQCQARLNGLRSLSAAAQELRDDDVDKAANDSSGWLESMLVNLRLETRAGRSIPIGGDSLDDLTQTEGSVLALVRSVGDSLGGMLIGRCRLEGDVGEPGAKVQVSINVSVRYGESIPGLAARLREAVLRRLLAETELNITGVNISVTDILPERANTDQGGVR